MVSICLLVTVIEIHFNVRASLHQTGESAQSTNATAMVLLNLVPLPNGATPSVGVPVLLAELLQLLDDCQNILSRQRGFAIVVNAADGPTNRVPYVPTLPPVSNLKRVAPLIGRNCF